MPDQNRTIAFFGATGGCALSCLVLALETGYGCTALARTPSKLRDLLQQRGVKESTVAEGLVIVSGDVTDIDAVKSTLTFKGRRVDLIVSGVGGAPDFSNPLAPTIDNPTICQDATRTILAAAGALNSPNQSRKPVLITIGTTGTNDKARDVPLLMMPLYHWVLKVPHADKRAMESLLREAMQKPPAQRPIENYVVVRPSMLTNGDDSGLENVRSGGEESPAIGYTITRRQVGRWIFENLVQEGKYPGEMVSLTT